MIDKLYVLGHPVAHSKSPVMHNAAYRALGLPWDYGFADCAREADARALIEGREWLALNVTMPYKPLAFECASLRSEDALLVQGANVLVNWGGQLHADNTDGRGCVAFLEKRGVRFEGSAVAVCGTGPTSLAIMHACTRAGAARVSLLGRNGRRAQQVLDGYLERLGAGSGECIFRACAYEGGGAEAVRASSVVIDATPLGMNPGDPAPFDTAVLREGQVVLDVVYGHGETALASAAREAGCAFFDGAGMLVGQAVETVQDIARITGAFEVAAGVDLFAVMAKAAGFEIA